MNKGDLATYVASDVELTFKDILTFIQDIANGVKK
jgi:hypothetical protein